MAEGDLDPKVVMASAQRVARYLAVRASIGVGVPELIDSVRAEGEELPTDLLTHDLIVLMAAAVRP